MKSYKKILQSSLICISVFAFVSFLHFSGFFTWSDNKAYDSRMNVTAPFFSPSEQIAVVVLDQTSLDWAKEKLGWSWPWPRESYGKMIDFFNRGNAASIAFDMVYTEPSIYGAADDEALAKSCSDFGKVIQTVFYSSSVSKEGLKPIPIIEKSAALLGNVQSLFDEDGIDRRVRFYSESALHEPSLAIASLAISGKLPDISKIPIAKGGGMYVRYLEDLDRFAPYNAEQILRSEFAIEKAEREGVPYDAGDDLLDPSNFEGIHIFFGLYAPGLFDICSTPMASTYPGVGVHISQMDTILKNEYLADASLLLVILLLAVSVVGGLLIGETVSYVRVRTFLLRSLLFLFICLAYLVASCVVFANGIILPVSAPLVAFTLSVAVTVCKNYMTEGRQRRYLKTAFRQYLSPAVIDNLIDNPSALKLGGEEREITAYFSDVQGFTSISEKLNPSELTDLLNKYLSAMTDIILEHGGTIDKYEGDAIIAFWNAPTFQKDHAKRALEAALACQQKLVEMQDELVAVTGKPFKQRIGLNTGRAVVGNMGSRSRFDYTMLGDAVNLASRLEGINKQFDTYTMCSNATMQSAVENGCTFKFRQLSNIAVVGRKEGVLVYEPMLEQEFAARKPEFDVFAAAYKLFVQGQFEKAKAMFASIRDKDPAAGKYIEKCDMLMKNPPANWDGILRATEK